MSRHYILDGYNVLHSTDRWDSLPREKKREQFLRFLDDKRATGSLRNSVTVVLDGYAASLERIRLKFIRLIFSADRDADSVIKEWVAGTRNPRDCVVVTNDRSIQNTVREHGATVMSCEDFLTLGRKSKTTRNREKLDAGTAEAISREMKRYWKL